MGEERELAMAAESCGPLSVVMRLLALLPLHLPMPLPPSTLLPQYGFPTCVDPSSGIYTITNLEMLDCDVGIWQPFVAGTGAQLVCSSTCKAAFQKASPVWWPRRVCFVPPTRSSEGTAGCTPVPSLPPPPMQLSSECKQELLQFEQWFNTQGPGMLQPLPLIW